VISRQKSGDIVDNISAQNDPSCDTVVASVYSGRGFNSKMLVADLLKCFVILQKLQQLFSFLPQQNAAKT
jgi:hypothetical protein